MYENYQKNLFIFHIFIKSLAHILEVNFQIIRIKINFRNTKLHNVKKTRCVRSVF